MNHGYIIQNRQNTHLVDDIIATEAEKLDGRFTGKVKGIPSFQGGKIQRLKIWLEQQTASFETSYFYSDSINDLPLLEYVDRPCVANGDEKLLTLAAERNWPMINLRADNSD